MPTLGISCCAWSAKSSVGWSLIFPTVPLCISFFSLPPSLVAVLRYLLHTFSLPDFFFFFPPPYSQFSFLVSVRLTFHCTLLSVPLGGVDGSLSAGAVTLGGPVCGVSAYAPGRSNPLLVPSGPPGAFDTGGRGCLVSGLQHPRRKVRIWTCTMRFPYPTKLYRMALSHVLLSTMPF